MSLVRQHSSQGISRMEPDDTQASQILPALFFAITRIREGRASRSEKYAFVRLKKSFMGQRIEPAVKPGQFNTNYLISGGTDWSDLASEMLNVRRYHKLSERFQRAEIDLIYQDKVTITLIGIPWQEYTQLRDYHHGRLAHLLIFNKLRGHRLSHSKGNMSIVFNTRFDLAEAEELLAFTLEHSIPMEMFMETDGRKEDPLAVGGVLWKRATKRFVKMAKGLHPPMIPRELWLSLVDWIADWLITPEPIEDAHEAAMKTAGFDLDDSAFAMDCLQELQIMDMMPLLPAAPEYE